MFEVELDHTEKFGVHVTENDVMGWQVQDNGEFKLRGADKPTWDYSNAYILTPKETLKQNDLMEYATDKMSKEINGAFTLLDQELKEEFLSKFPGDVKVYELRKLPPKQLERMNYWLTGSGNSFEDNEDVNTK